MPKHTAIVVALLAFALVVNVAVLIRIGGPLFVDYVPRAPEGISCQGCESPQVQTALAQAASAGRAQIQRSGENALWWAAALVVVNIIVPIVAWRLGRGAGTV